MITKDSILLHIPHSSLHIPYMECYDTSLIQHELDLLTDHATDTIFDIGCDKIVFPYSRIYCDVERYFDDSKEPMAKVGRGYYYTHTDDGNPLRIDDFRLRNMVASEYWNHHYNLESAVDNKLTMYGTCLLIDCHSYSDKPFNTDLDKRENRPDICLGTDAFHTPYWLLDAMQCAFESFGLSVGIDWPYSGTIIPTKHFEKESNLYGIMIELNRKLYMDGFEVNTEKAEWLKDLINQVIAKIIKYFNT